MWFHGHWMGCSSHVQVQSSWFFPRFERVFRVLNAMEAKILGLWPWMEHGNHGKHRHLGDPIFRQMLMIKIWVYGKWWCLPCSIILWTCFDGKIWNMMIKHGSLGIVWRRLKVFSDCSTDRSQWPNAYVRFHWVWTNTSCGKVESSQWRTWSQNFDESEW